MSLKVGIAAPMIAAGMLCGLLAGAAISTPSSVLADGAASTAVDPVNPISGTTGAPLGDANDGADPLVPYGTDPQAPVTPGYVNPNHDAGVTSNGQVDLPF